MDDGKDLEKVALIDVFSEDDILIAASSSPLGAPKASGHSEVNRSPMEYRTKCSMLADQVPLPSDSPETKCNTSCKYNLRKSLAWDSAFFTSEGVLDPEELADVNSTFKKVQACMLPGIPEDTRKSSESYTSYVSDSCTVDCTEVDVFEDLRASIQKLQIKHNKDPSLSHTSNTLSSRKIDALAIESRIGSLPGSAIKNGHLSSQDKMEPSVAPKKHGLRLQRVVEISKETANHPKAAATESKEKLQLRPPRTASRLPMAPNRGPAFGSFQQKTKVEETLLVSGDVGNSQSVVGRDKSVPGPMPSNKGLSGSSIKLHALASCSKSRSSSNSSVRAGKAPLEGLRKKTSSRDSANILPVRDSKSRHGIRNDKTPLKFSPSISPSSSIDSLASESSSSSASTSRKPTNSPTAHESSSSSPCGGAPDCTAPRGNPRRVPQGEQEVKASFGTRLSTSSSAFNATRCSISSSGAKEFKPSGLRLPSPKIGYFDTEKPLPHGSSSCSRRCTQVSLIPKPSGLNNAGAVKQRPDKLQLAPSASSDEVSNREEKENVLPSGDQTSIVSTS